MSASASGQALAHFPIEAQLGNRLLQALAARAGSPALSASLARFGDLPRRHTAELFLGEVAPLGRLEVVEPAMGRMAGLGLQMFGINDAVTVRISLFRTYPQGVWC